MPDAIDKYLDEKHTNAKNVQIITMRVVKCWNCNAINAVNDAAIGRISFCGNCGCPHRCVEK